MNKEADESSKEWIVRYETYKKTRLEILNRRSAPIAVAVDAYLESRSGGASKEEMQKHADRINELSGTLNISLDEIERILGFSLEI